MIDIERKIFTRLATAIRNSFPDAVVGSEYVRTPSKFPFIAIIEQDNSTVHSDSGNKEKYADLTYSVSVFTNKTGTKKTQAREIMNFIDEMLCELNFKRTSLNAIPNLYDSTIYRLEARYRAITDGDKIFRR